MANPAPEEQRKVTVSFRKSDDYRLYPVTDVYGGTTVDGDAVFFHLTVDHFPTPSYQTFIPDSEGRINLGDVKETISAGDIEKELLCGIMLTPEAAVKIGNWLLQRGNDIIDSRK